MSEPLQPAPTVDVFIPDLHALAVMIADALTVADQLGEGAIALLLNDALIEAGGTGVFPPQALPQVDAT